jgi:hypothetical protein
MELLESLTEEQVVLVLAYARCLKDEMAAFPVRSIPDLEGLLEESV